MQKRSYNILGVRVDNVTLDEALEYIKKLKVKSQKLEVKKKKILQIVTVNPEFVVLAQENKTFKKVVNRASLSLPDGIGILLAGVLSGQKFKERVTGIDLMKALCQWAVKEGLTVGLIGGRPKIAVKAGECLEKKYPGLRWWAEEGPWIEASSGTHFLSSVNRFLKEKISKSLAEGKAVEVWQDEQTRQLVANPSETSVSSSYKNLRGSNSLRFRNGSLRRLARKIKETDILFVAMGAPKQEFFIDYLAHSSQLIAHSLLVAMGIGGAFDELVGQVKPAPGWVEKFGFKWLWRLLQEPWRWRRQLKLLEFVYLVIRDYSRSRKKIGRG